MSSRAGSIKVLGIGAAAFCVFGALFTMDWSERRLIAEFAESLVACVLYLVGVVVPFAAAFYAGQRAHDRTGRDWIAWAAGILAFFAVGILLLLLIAQIPGVGWRVEALRDIALPE